MLLIGQKGRDLGLCKRTGGEGIHLSVMPLDVAERQVTLLVGPVLWLSLKTSECLQQALSAPYKQGN